MTKTKQRLHAELWERLYDVACGDDIDKIVIWINENYVPKTEVQKVLDNGHGGGNFRRLLINLLK